MTHTNTQQQSSLCLFTTRLHLRDFKPDDWERVHLYSINPDFSQYEAWGPNTVEDSQKFVNDMVQQAATEPRFHFDLAVCLKDTEALIGSCTLRKQSQNSHVANLGWAIHPEFQNQGYATEAAQALIKFGTEKWDLRVIYATCDVRNVASYKVMEKLGMQRVGHLQGHLKIKGHLRDTYRYEWLVPTL